MNKPDYNLIMTQELSNVNAKVLMHCCCGPCATSVTERVKPLCSLTLFWYNPNVMGSDEEEKRKQNLNTVASFFDVEVIDGGYDNDVFIQKVKGLEKEKDSKIKKLKSIPLSGFIKVSAF